jgi:hypothetical protein
MGWRQLFFGEKMAQKLERERSGMNAQFSVTQDSQNAHTHNTRNQNIFVRVSDYFCSRSEFSYDTTNILS